MTMLSGPFSAAMAIWSRYGSSAAVTCGSVAKTAAMHPPARQGLHQPGPLGDQPDAVLQGVNARHAGRHELADAVPQYGRRFDPPTLPERCQGVFQREHHRLRVARLVQKRACLWIQKRKQRAVEFRAEQFRAAVERRAENRLGFIERAAHSGVLCALSREKKGDARRTIAAPGLGRRRRPRDRRETVAARRPPLASSAAGIARRWAKCVRPTAAV